MRSEISDMLFTSIIEPLASSLILGALLQKFKIFIYVIRDLLYVDDCDLVTYTEIVKQPILMYFLILALL